MNSFVVQTSSALGGKFALLCLILLFLLAPLSPRACNLSYVQLDSVTDTGNGQWDIYVTACVGAGISGFSKGGAADTYTFAFVFYSSCNASLAISEFPASVKGNETGAEYWGFNFGPVGPPFDAQAAVLYLNPSYQPFVCVNATGICGPRHSQCDQYRFRVAELPDSIRVLGFEGAGNALGGCYPDADMMVDIPGNPCGRVAGPAISPPVISAPSVANPEAEQFFDSGTESVPVTLALDLFPNPNRGVFALRAQDPHVELQTVVVSDLTGRRVALRNSVRMGERLDFSHLAPGSYILSVNGEDGQAWKRFVIR
ncbi:MAG: T9SS type A sorting domain-containing protein [Bacteroidota bacterium]